MIRYAIYFLVFLTLYVLSIGPMFWYWYEAEYLGGSEWILVLYQPLRYATQIPLFEDLINNYINWWNL